MPPPILENLPVREGANLIGRSLLLNGVGVFEVRQNGVESGTECREEICLFTRVLNVGDTLSKLVPFDTVRRRNDKVNLAAGSRFREQRRDSLTHVARLNAELSKVGNQLVEGNVLCALGNLGPVHVNLEAAGFAIPVGDRFRERSEPASDVLNHDFVTSGTLWNVGRAEDSASRM